MEFFNYMFFDTLGTVQGLIASSYLIYALKNGLILTPIILLFIFLSVIRIAYDTIVKKEYGNVLKHVAFLLIFIFAFSLYSPARIWNVNLTKGMWDGQMNTHLKVLSWTSFPVDKDLSSGYIDLSNVSLVNAPLWLVDEFAFATSKAILGSDNLKENLIKQKVKTNPSTLIDMAYIKYLMRAERSGGTRLDINNESLAKKLKEVAFCFKVPQTLEFLASQEKDEGRKKTIKKLAEDIQTLPFAEFYNCKSVFRGIADEVRSLSSDIFSSSSVEDSTYNTFFEGVAENIEDGAIPVSIKVSIAQALIKERDFVTALNNYYSATRSDESSAKTFFERAYSGLKYMFSNALTDRTYNEWFLYKINSLAIFILIAMFPIAFALTFLPAFGYNFRFLASYLFSYFLVKMWIPLYLIAYEVLSGKMFNAISSTVTVTLHFLLPSSAFASPSEVFTFMSLAMPEIEKFNTLLLNVLAMSIPTALGGGSLFLLGRDFFIASQKAVAESMFLGKAGLFLGMSALNKIGLSGVGRGTSMASNTVSSTSSGQTVSISETLKAGGTKITEFKQTDSGLYVPSGTKIVAGNIRTGTYPTSTGIMSGISREITLYDSKGREIKKWT